MKNVLTFVLCCLCAVAVAQPSRYSPANGHSHNDYNQPVPFWMAYQSGMGSIEADIFLYQGELIVSHDEQGLAWHKTLANLYLDKLKQSIADHAGHPFADSSMTLQMLIDIKSDSLKTLHALVEILKKYPSITGSSKISIVITGNRPDPATFASYPSYIYFDGILSDNYTSGALTKIELLSDNFRKYSHWNGGGEISSADRLILANKIDEAHRLKKKVRFWNAPDSEHAWKQLMELGVDFINTDHVKELSKYLSHGASNS